MIRKATTRILAVLLILILLTGCGNVNDVRSEPTALPATASGTPGNDVSISASLAPSGSPGEQNAPPVYNINSVVLDGNLSEWSSQKPVAEDPSGDAMHNGADLLSLYAVRDSQYLYVAASFEGESPTINFNVDTDNDNVMNFGFNYQPDAKRVFFFKNEKGSIVQGDENPDAVLGRGIELRIPVESFGNAGELKISALTNTNKPDYTTCDQLDGWYPVATCDGTITCDNVKNPGEENNVADSTQENNTGAGSGDSKNNGSGNADGEFKITLDPSALGKVRIAGGWDHTVLLKNDGTVWGWGDNELGQVGNGSMGDGDLDTYDSIVTSPQTIIDCVKQIGATYEDSFALKSDGTLWAWGSNRGGRLGDGTENNYAEPQKIADNVQSIASGLSNHQMFVKNDNTLWGTGSNFAGQLGTGSEKDAKGMVKVMDGVKMAALGEKHSAILKTDGSLWTVGNNDYGQLGDGSFESRTTPVKVMDGVKYAACGSYGTYAIKNDDTLWAWGFNRCGEAGVGMHGKVSAPVKILDHVAYVAPGIDYTFAVRYDSTLWAWGDASNTWQSNQIDSPVKVMDNVQYVASGMEHAFLIKSDNTVWAWGNNAAGQLGTGDTENRSKPVEIMTLK